ncbi:RNase H family protein [Paenibacillus lupini]|uniref:RNase H family protein n=1 Tax=Paenibacillus lupini TaxID=1450204 RepID=UPI00141F0372|nr:RNase H family protein [Paenibacillus lupini]NIK22097.1 ribonuclease HI [Paenibacillus lupini]
MDVMNDLLVKKAFTSPKLRPYILNKGTMFLYCDYAGFASRNVYGAACCMVFNRVISITAKKLPITRDQGSNYGELMAIILSLETLAAALVEHQPKIAVIFTDCIRISHLLNQEKFSQHVEKQGRDELLSVLDNLKRMYPEVDIQIKYISKHKKNNHLHRLAHNTARETALKT